MVFWSDNSLCIKVYLEFNFLNDEIKRIFIEDKIK
jgi:hypothetical protein